MTDVTPHSGEGAWHESASEWLTVGIAGFLVGAAVGWWGEGLARGEAARPAPPALAESAEPGLRSEEGELRLEYAAWLEKLDEMGRRVVPEATFSHLALPALDGAGRIREEIRDLFLLTDHEVERLNRVIEEAAEDLLEAEQDHLEILGMTGDEAIFLIPAFEEGEVIERSLRQGVLGILGDKDGELLWEMLRGSGIGDEPGRWRGFGRQDREILFSVREDGPGSSRTVSGEGDGGAARLYYEERIPDETHWLLENGNGWRVEVSRSAPLVRNREGAPPEDGEQEHGLFFAPEIERFGYLVPHMPDGLRMHFQE